MQPPASEPSTMTRQSLENLTGRPSADGWAQDPNSVEMQSTSVPRLSVNEWRSSGDTIRPAPRNPFQDPAVPHNSREASIDHPSAAHTHQDHVATDPGFRTDIESQHDSSPKAFGTPSITALPLNLPYSYGREEHSQRFHKAFLICRGLVHVVLFVLALIGFLLKYPKRITYTGMLTGNSLAFVLVWAAVLVIVYFGDKTLRMSRFTSKKDQWRKCVKLVVLDLLVVWVWLLVSWGNTAFAKGVMEEAAKQALGLPGMNAGAGAPKFTPPVLAPKPTGT